MSTLDKVASVVIHVVIHHLFPSLDKVASVSTVFELEAEKLRENPHRLVTSATHASPATTAAFRCLAGASFSFADPCFTDDGSKNILLNLLIANVDVTLESPATSSSSTAGPCLACRSINRLLRHAGTRLAPLATWDSTSAVGSMAGVASAPFKLATMALSPQVIFAILECVPKISCSTNNLSGQDMCCLCAAFGAMPASSATSISIASTEDIFHCEEIKCTISGR